MENPQAIVDLLNLMIQNFNQVMLYIDNHDYALAIPMLESLLAQVEQLASFFPGGSSELDVFFFRIHRGIGMLLMHFSLSPQQLSQLNNNLPFDLHEKFDQSNLEMVSVLHELVEFINNRGQEEISRDLHSWVILRSVSFTASVFFITSVIVGCSTRILGLQM